MQRDHARFLYPPGGTGCKQNQSHRGNNGDALERGAIAESRLAEAHRHIHAKQIGRLTFVLLRMLSNTRSLNVRFTWNTIEQNIISRGRNSENVKSIMYVQTSDTLYKK